MNTKIVIEFEQWEARGLIVRLEELKQYDREIVKAARSSDPLSELLNILYQIASYTHEDRMSLSKAGSNEALRHIASWKARMLTPVEGKV